VKERRGGGARPRAWAECEREEREREREVNGWFATKGEDPGDVRWGEGCCILQLEMQ
jgi:hypothetical protein